MIDFYDSVFTQGAKMCRFFVKFRALFSTLKQIMCHNSKNAQPISTKFQPLLNLYERQAWDALPKQLINFCLTSYRALDLEHDIAGGLNIEFFPI